MTHLWPWLKVKVIEPAMIIIYTFSWTIFTANLMGIAWTVSEIIEHLLFSWFRYICLSLCCQRAYNQSNKTPRPKTASGSKLSQYAFGIAFWFGVKLNTANVCIISAIKFNTEWRKEIKTATSIIAASAQQTSALVWHCRVIDSRQPLHANRFHKEHRGF